MLCCSYKNGFFKFLLLPIFITILSIPSIFINNRKIQHILLIFICLLTIIYFILTYTTNLTCSDCKNIKHNMFDKILNFRYLNKQRNDQK
jgi:glucan phosphoethanolaminetransferase (alkaline phosphatase superfamily)